jgi:hypothetical protein
MPVLRSARALAEAPITIVKKNPIDAKVKSLQDQLAAVSGEPRDLRRERLDLGALLLLDLRDLRAERLDFVPVALILGVRRGELVSRRALIRIPSYHMHHSPASLPVAQILGLALGVVVLLASQREVGLAAAAAAERVRQLRQLQVALLEALED